MIGDPMSPFLCFLWRSLLSLPLLIAACGGQRATPDTGADAESSDAAPPEDGTSPETDSGSPLDSTGPGADASVSDTGTAPPTDSTVPIIDGSEPYPIVDASGDCGHFPEHCCADTIPCVGYCVRFPNNQIGCDCYGIQGGCWPDGSGDPINGAMCCFALAGCATAGACGAGGQ